MLPNPQPTEPIESEIKVLTPLKTYPVFRNGRRYEVQARVPMRCRRVWACLAGEYVGREPDLVRETGWWRKIDIIMTTGHNCDDRKLRELRELNPNLIESRRREGGSGSYYHVYRIRLGDQVELF